MKTPAKLLSAAVSAVMLMSTLPFLAFADEGASTVKDTAVKDTADADAQPESDTVKVTSEERTVKKDDAAPDTGTAAAMAAGTVLVAVCLATVSHKQEK